MPLMRAPQSTLRHLLAQRPAPSRPWPCVELRRAVSSAACTPS